MEEHGYLLVNNEKTIVMKWDSEEEDFIIHGLFVDDFATTPTSQRLKEEFKALYSNEFDVTGGGPMTSFLGLEAERTHVGIFVQLDKHFEKLVREYHLIQKEFLKCTASALPN